jgi:iron complex outermembrane receptor protein
MKPLYSGRPRQAAPACVRVPSLPWTALALIILTISESLYAGTSISGKVHDADGQPLKGVAITVAKTSFKTYSDDRGMFTVRLTGSTGTVQLRFESPGYYPETLLYETKEPAPSLDVLLTPRTIIKQEVKVVASRLDMSLATNPAATTVVGAEMLDAMPRSIAIDEPLHAVPGVKVDNQANGERVHLSIRGQGILSERGIRGIQVLYDGVPLNDPSGFCPDVYDIDWAGVEQVNVVRGPVAFLFGGGSAGGVIDVHTRAAEAGPLHGGLWAEGGSNGFYKTRGEISGKVRGIAYLISGSRTAGDGYRDHTAFWANNLYGRFSFRPVRSLRLSPFIMGTGFFNQNAEGLNLNWGYPNPRWWTMANPDALTYNEYQKTGRVTGGLNGEWDVADNQRVSFTFYTRHTAYKEPVPSSVEHRDLNAPGGSLQYELDSGHDWVKNRFSSGLDLDGQWVDDRRHPNIGNAVETPELLANQSILQSRAGGYWTDRLTLGARWTLLGSVRFDHIGNSLTDLLRANGLDLSGSRNFARTTGRVGVTFSTGKDVALFASWGQGFLPPATEELYANPAALGGFNQTLVPATSMGEEVGARGNHHQKIFWELEVFRLDTKHDFERYRIDSRPLETFYGNAGESRRYGVESEVRWLPLRRITVTAAYTYSHFIYTKYTSLTYLGDLTGNDLPNSPRQQGFVDASWEFLRSWSLGASTEAYSRAFIDPTNQTWIRAYGLLNARFSKTWQHRGLYGTFFVAGKNLTGKRYIAFTEPDPDGNSYQPGANREFFGGLQIRF